MEPNVVHPACVVYATLCFLTILNEASVVAFQSTSSDLEGQDHMYPSTVAPGDTRTPLTLGLMLSFSGDYVTKDAIPGVQIAVDTINAGDFLPGYRLQYSLTNSQCDQTVTLTHFFEDIAWSRPSKVGFIGGGCDDSTIKTAEISYFFNLTQLSCDSTTPEGEDRTKFKRYFQILPNDILFSQAFIQILNTFNWTKLHAINLEFHLFVQTLNLLESLEQLSPHHNFTSVSYSSDPRATNTLDAILSNGQAFNTESRIIYLAMYVDDIIPVLCEAYHQNKVYPLYVFITLGWYTDGWWDSSTVNCTSHQMEIALNRSLAMTLDPLIKDTNMTTSSRLSFNQYRKLYLEGVSRLNLSDVYDGEPCFDAVWSYAIALNRTIQDLRSDPAFNRLAAAASHLPPNSTFYMENFTYANDVILERMYQHLMNASFVGITGNISFNANGIRNAERIRIQQYRFNNSNQLQKFDIGYVTLDQNGQSVAFDFLPGESMETIWPDGVPHDGTLIKSTINIEPWVTAVMYILATLGIALAIICFIFMVVFRERKFIRLTSPNINYITCGGCMVLYTSIFFLAIQSTDETITTAICNVRIWLWAIGYSVAFGPVLGKMYRVYYIFNNPKPNKKRGVMIKDWMIGVLISVLAGIDVIILVIVTAVPELRTTAVLKQSTEYPQIVSGAFHDTTINCIFICDSQKGYTIWHGVLFGYKGLIQVVAILLAFGTRKVKVKGLDDSKYIAAIIYVTSICLVVVIISFATLRDKVNTLAAIYSLGFWCAATIILLLVFIPKFFATYKDPEGQTVFPSTIVQVDSDHCKVVALEKRIQILEQQLAHEHKSLENMKQLTISHDSNVGFGEVIQYDTDCNDSFESADRIEDYNSVVKSKEISLIVKGI
ncbi:hypothetical protein EMCRGX_G028803 [Ephydatia muelleri]